MYLGIPPILRQILPYNTTEQHPKDRHMKRHILGSILLLCTGLVFGPVCNAQSSSFASARILLVDHNLGNTSLEGLETTYAIELGLRHQLGRKFGLALPLKLGVSDVGQLDNINITAVDLLARYAPLGDKYKVSPYLQGGYGLVWERDGENQRQIPLGLGLDFTLGRNLSFSVQGEYRISDMDGRNNAMLGLGYVYRFRGGGAADRDGDGVRDRDDICPDDRGPASTYGCPDGDGDGTLNDQDRCPTIPGPRELLGCPDTDEDGVPDIDDDCPEVWGLANVSGCPDYDRDGVVDDEDECPTEVGPRKFNGCPDRDNDDVPDSEDQCPDQPGIKLLKGCPDTDGDGVPDDIDKCPNLTGSLLTGCPDRDNDGVDDQEDDCPDTPGKNRGCPELDAEITAELNAAAQNVKFETRSANLKPESAAVLDKVADLMRRYPGYRLVIEGHTDNVGTEDNNLKLSQLRAGACRLYLVEQAGINENRINSLGYGAARPRGDNGTVEGRAANRRVEFALTPLR